MKGLNKVCNEMKGGDTVAAIFSMKIDKSTIKRANIFVL